VSGGRETERRSIRLSCGDFSFPLLEHEQALDLIAMLGLEGVDLALMGNRSHVRPEQVRDDLPGWTKRLERRIRERGLEVADVFFIPWSDFQTLAPNHPDPAERERSRELFRVALELAAGLGADGLTLLPGIPWPKEPWQDSLGRAAEELARRLEEGRRLGLRVSVEPHVGSLIDTPARTLRLLERCPGLELTLDYTHFVFAGVPVAEVDPLLRYARHLHARGGARGRLQTPLRESEIDYGRLVDLLLAQGFQDWIALEYVWTPADPPGSPYDLVHADTVSETILLRDLIRARPAEVASS